MPAIVEVNDRMCEAIARVLERYSIPADIEDTAIEGMDAARISNFYFLLVAICHQTQSLQGIVDGSHHRGWDYLRLKLLREVIADNVLLEPTTWRKMTDSSLSKLFNDAHYGETLTDVEGRSSLIRDLGTELESKGLSSVHDVYLASKGQLAGESSGLVARISKFRAYSDPVQKKAYFFLGLMQNSQSWKYVDEMELGAPVDYHEVRGHLRLGTVRIGSDLRTTLAASKPVSKSEDIAIRTAVRQAITQIASLTNQSPMRLHYLFWNLFRNVCLRENPKCFSADRSIIIPSRYRHFMEHGKCPFAEKCESAGKGSLLIEHSFDTDWY